jgi:hypothetical protein
MNGAINHCTHQKGFRSVDIRQAVDDPHIGKSVISFSEHQFGAGLQRQHLSECSQGGEIGNVGG